MWMVNLEVFLVNKYFDFSIIFGNSYFKEGSEK